MRPPGLIATVMLFPEASRGVYWVLLTEGQLSLGAGEGPKAVDCAPVVVVGNVVVVSRGEADSD